MLGHRRSKRHREDRRVRRVAIAVTVLAGLFVGVLPSAPANAAAATVFTGPSCQNGTTQLLATWAGATVGATTLSTTAAVPTSTTVVNLNTATSGYPANSVNLSYVSATGTPSYALWTPTGAAPQYNVPSFEMRTSLLGASTHTVDITFPSPTTVYFPIFDVDTNERLTIQGFNGATAVAGTNTIRTPSANMTVSTAGTTTTFQAGSTNTPDNDALGLVDVSYPTPVTRIRLVDTLPFGTNEIGNLYSCQAQDLVKSATTPTLSSLTGSTATYHTDMTFTVGNTEPAGGMRVYAPQVTDSLASALSGSPNYSAIAVTGITATGPVPACQVNSGYSGVGVNTMLQGSSSGFLEPGQACTITVGVNVTYPVSVTPFTKNNTATVSAAGTNPTLSESSTNGSTLPSAPKGDNASPTPLVFPAISPPRLSLTKALATPREAASDQFTVAIRTGGAAGTVVSNAAASTTSGSGSTVTPGTGTTGTYVATAGTAYTFTEAASGTTALANYTARITCTDSTGVQPGLPVGAVFNPASPPTITPLLGANISCILTNAALPIMTWNKVNDKPAGAKVNPGDVVTYTISMTNSGSVANPSFSAFDDLTNVVTNASFNTGSITISPAGTGTAVYDAATKHLTWTGPVAANSTVTVSYSVTVRAGAFGELRNVFIDKSVVNPIGASVQWRKIDATVAKALLAGAEWTLTPVNAAGQATGAATAVVDCVAATAASCTGADKDPIGGQFFVSGVTPGTYRLVETKAPVGFVLNSTPIPVTVSATTQTTVIADVVNQQQQVPLIPLTGGLGTDHLLIAGGGLLALMICLGLGHFVRRRRMT